MRVDERTGNCTLDILRRLHRQGRIHNIFAPDKLKKYHLRENDDIPDDPNHDDETPEYEIEKILDHKKDQGKDYWFIKWKYYGEDSNSWEPDEHVRDTALEAIIDYLTKKNEDEPDTALMKMGEEIEDMDIEMGWV